MSAVSFAVITADRPEVAAQCLASYWFAPGSVAEVLLMDDSRRRAPTAPPGVRHVTREHRRAFAERLANAGVSPDAAQYCLLGFDHGWFTAGANRNAALLMAAGQRMLMVDDDTRGELRGNRASGLCLGGPGDPTDIRFFENRDEALSAGTRIDADVAAEDAQYLGMQLSDGSRVRLVSHGVAGDSGFYSPAHLLWLTSPSTGRRLRSSDATLATAMRSREVFRMVEQRTVTRGTVCMATAIGLDNRDLLPPFLPVGRNEDGFFGNLLHRTMPDAVTMHLPIAVAHVPSEIRPYSRFAGDPQTLRLSELIILLMSIQTVGTFQALGEHLKMLSKNPATFVSKAREIVQVSRRALLTRIEDCWGNFTGCSPSWISLAGQLQWRLLELIGSPDCWRPMELSQASENEAAAETARIAGLTGEMLCEWPVIVEAARYFRDTTAP